MGRERRSTECNKLDGKNRGKEETTDVEHMEQDEEHDEKDEDGKPGEVKLERSADRRGIDQDALVGL